MQSEEIFQTIPEWAQLFSQCRGGSRIFFRRGCTRLLLYFNTNKSHSFFFFCRIPIVLENCRSSQGRVRTPCTLPLDPLLQWLQRKRQKNHVTLTWKFPGKSFSTTHLSFLSYNPKKLSQKLSQNLFPPKWSLLNAQQEKKKWGKKSIKLSLTV